MADFDDLLAGIRAFPADELRRLVFADWLDENAHANPVYAPWASHIRWAIAAARTPRTDPDYWKYRRYPESPPPGVAKLLGADTQHFKFKWHAGFPDTLDLATDTLVAHGHRIAALPGPLRSLTVGNAPHSPSDPSARWVDSPVVGRIGHLTAGILPGNGRPVLTALAARGRRLPPIELTFWRLNAELLATFVGSVLPTLTGLNVFTGLSDLSPNDLKVLAAAPAIARLRSLELRDTRTGVGYAPLADGVPNLENLSVGGACVSAFLEAVAADRTPRLTHLETSVQTVESLGWAAFVGSLAFRKLTRLGWIGDAGSRHEDAPVWPDHLPEPDAGDLTLSAAHLSPPRSVALFSSPLLHRCSCLFVVNSGPGADAYVALAENPSARNLKVLSIQMPFKSEPVATGEPFAALCQSPHLAGLTELSLTFHSLTDDDFGQLLTATFAGNLRYLNLAGSYFSERILARLLDPDVMPALTWLDIHGPKESDHPLGVAFRERFGPNFAF